MIHCPNCEVSLSPADLRAGKCPVCHTIITPDLETIPASPANRTAQPQLSLSASSSGNWTGALTDDHATLPVAGEHPTEESTAPQKPPRRRGIGALIIIAIAAVVVLVAALLFHQTQIPSHGNTAADGRTTVITTIVTNTTAPSSKSSTTPGPAQSISTPGAGTPPVGSPTVGAPTPTIAITPSPTTTPGQPALYVAPRSFSSLACVNAKETFTITNTGSATLRWSASTSYTLNQTPGPLAAGANIAVTISGIYKSGNVIISATDQAGNSLPTSPQTVTVNCTV